QAEDGIRDFHVTGVQTCALPISIQPPYAKDAPFQLQPTEFPPPGPYEVLLSISAAGVNRADVVQRAGNYPAPPGASQILGLECEIGRASCRERVEISIGAGSGDE